MPSLNAQLLPLLLLWLLATMTPGEAHGRSLVEQWLEKPDVRVLIVVFTTADCPACRRAHRHWAKLHQRYRHQGLRIVEVGDGTAKGRKSGWHPDALQQDPNLDLHQAWKVEDYPQAFVWSWGGVPLAAHAGPALVEDTVRAYFYALPRILVENPVDRNGRPPQGAGALRMMVEQELTRQSKFVVVASESDRAHLRKLRKRSLRSQTQDELRCRLGKEIPPNTLWMGTPAKFVRELRDDERERFKRTRQVYASLKERYRNG